MSKRMALMVMVVVVLATVVMAACGGSSAIEGIQETQASLIVVNTEVAERIVALEERLMELASMTASQMGLIEQQRERLDALSDDVFRLRDRPVVEDKDTVCLLGNIAIENYIAPGESPRVILCVDIEVTSPVRVPPGQRGTGGVN